VRTSPRRWQDLLAEPRRPPSVRRYPNAHWLVVGTVCVGAFMGQLDASIVTQAFPTFQHDLHASLGGAQWVGLAYLLALVSLVTAVGRLADMVGRKLLYIYGFLIFIAGSALCATAPGLPELVGFRVLQAVGAAMLQANSVAIIASAMPAHELGRGIGVQGAAQALGLALGPAVGGLLIALGGWRLIFYVNVPAGAIGALLGWFLIPRSHHLAPREPFDWGGLAIFVPPVVALLIAVSYGNELGWASRLVVALFSVVAVGSYLFIWWERHTRSPMLDLSLFSRGPFRYGISSGLLSYMVMFGVLFVVPYFLELDLGLPVGRAGLELMAMPAGLGLVAPFAGRLAEHLGARALTVGGMLLTGGALGLLAVEHRGTVPFLVELALAGTGLGLFMPPNNAAIMGAAPRDASGVASGVLNTARGLGTSLGLAATGLVFGAIAGAHPHIAADVERGFEATVLFLAGTSVLAALLAGLRGQAVMGRGPLAVEG